MIVKKILRSGNSCNFCSSGVLSKNNHARLEYPYKHVTEISGDNGGGIKVCICDDCLEELFAKTKFNEL